MKKNLYLEIYNGLGKEYDEYTSTVFGFEKLKSIMIDGGISCIYFIYQSKITKFFIMNQKSGIEIGFDMIVNRRAWPRTSKIPYVDNMLFNARMFNILKDANNSNL